MANHGGFGAVATITKEVAESVLWAYIPQGPMYFPAPDSIPVGPATVRFGGIFEMMRPTLGFHAFPANLITIHFKFHSLIRAQVVIPGTISISRGYDVELQGSVTLAPIIFIQNQQLFLGINTKSVVFTPLTAITLTGPALPTRVRDALQSPTLAALATAIVQSQPNLLITPPTLKTVIEKTVPGDFKEVGTSIFNWFTVRLEARNIVFKLGGGTITLAVDFLGHPAGDINQLDSAFGLDNVWISTRTPDDVEQNRPPYIWKGKAPLGGDFGILFNMDLLSQVVDSVSRQTAHTIISKNAELRSLSLGYSTFTKPLYPGLRDGFKLGFQATVHPSDINVSGAVYIQAVVTTYEGPTAFLRPDSWSLRIVHSELDTSWWIDLIVFAIAALAAVVFPALFPLFAVMAIAVTDGILPGLLDNARNSAAAGIEKSLFGLPSPSDDHTLPGLPGGIWKGNIKHIAIVPEGMRTVLDVSAWNPIGFPAIYMENGIRAPEDWHAEIRRPMPFSVKVSKPMAALANNLSVLWEVFRTDTNALLRSRTRRYLGDDVLFAIDPFAPVRGVQIDPASNGILIGLRDPDYYFLDRVKVRCTVTATIGTQKGVLWSDEVVVKIPDDLDRTRNFVEWGPHRVFFANAGTNNETWSHDRTSKIHRTATGARCMMLRQRAEASPRMRPKFRYFDTLPAEWNPLSEHRHFLCDFCFFGGPDKSTPFPPEKWF